MKRAALVIFVLIVAALVAVQYFAASRSFPALALTVERAMSEALGLEVRVRGDLRLDLLPTPHFEVTDIVVANPPGRAEATLLKIGTLGFQIKLRRLLFRAIEIDELELSDVEVAIETDETGALGLSTDPQGFGDRTTDEGFEVKVRRIEASNVRISYRNVANDAELAVFIEEFELHGEGEEQGLELHVRGVIEDERFSISGNAGSLAELLTPTKPWPVAIHAEGFDASLDLEGTLQRPRELQGVDLALSGHVPDLSLLFQVGEIGGLPLGGATIAARIHDSDGALGVSKLVVVTDPDAELHGTLKGSVDNLAEVRGVELAVEAEAPDARALAPLVDFDIPEGISLRAQGALSDADGTLGFEGSLRASAHGGDTWVEATGQTDDIRERDEIELQLRAEVREIAALEPYLELDFPLPRLGPLVATARLSDRDGSIGLHDLDLRLAEGQDTWITVSGSVDDLANFQGVRLEAESHLTDYGHASRVLQRPIPDLGPVHLNATLVDADSSLGIERFRLRGGRKGVFSVDVTGELDNLAALDEVDVHARLEAADLALLGEVIGVELPSVGRVLFNGRLRGSDERLDSSGTLVADKTVLKGNWFASFAPGARPRIEGTLRSAHVYLDDIGIAPEYEGLGQPLAEEVEARARERALAKDLTWDQQLRRFDARLVLRADRVTGVEGFEGSDFHTTITLDDGDLTITDTGVSYEDGTLSARMRIDARTPVPRVTLRFDAREIDATRLMAQLEADTQHAGRVDISLDLKSRGRERDELLANLSGDAGVVVRDGTLAGRFTREFVRELSVAMLPSLGGKNVPRLPCIMLVMTIDDGVGRVREMLLEGQGIAVQGRGRIFLADDRWALRLVPHVRDPRLLSVAPTVKVTGPLADPRFTPVARTLVTSATRAVVTNVLRPTRMLTSPFRSNGSENSEETCVLESVPADS